MIYTFYSYKGGVGRSMALANIAECFYLRGLRVLMVDWDLEAPGLETFFFESDTSKASGASEVDAVQSRLGLLDLLTEYKRAFPDLVKAASPSVESDGAPLGDRTSSVNGNNAILNGNTSAAPAAADDAFRSALSSALNLRSFLFPIHGSIKDHEAHLSLLPAGWRGRERFASYAEAVQGFDWQEFYAAFRGFEYFEWMKTEMARFADVVFIDSRTGVTEMGGVCARQLADVVVSFCAPNFQNVDGVARMVDSFRKRPDLDRIRNRRPLQTLVIPTRIEPKDLDRLRKFLTRFEERVDQADDRPPSIRDRSFWDLRIPFVSAYAYEEKRVIGPEGTVEQLDPTRSLENAYWKLATTLARLAPSDLRVQTRFADRIASEFGTPVPRTVISFERDADAAGRRVHAVLESAGVLLWPDLDHRSPSPLQSLEGSKSLLVVLSPAATTSTAIRDEIRQARERGTAVYLLRFGDLLPGMTRHDKQLENGAVPLRDPLPFWLARYPVYEADADATKLVQLAQHPPPTAAAPMMALPLPSDLIEFEDAPDFMAALQTSAALPSVLAIYGPAGSGKSTFVSATLRNPDIADQFNGIIWIDAGAATDEELAAQLRDALVRFRRDDPVPPVAADDRLWQRLRVELSAGNVVIVIDDPSDEPTLQRLLRETEGSTRVIVTRDRRLCAAASMSAVVPSLKQTEDQKLLKWPLLISLYRRALDRRLRLGDTRDRAEQFLAERLSRQGVIAFDVPNATARNDSVARSFSATLDTLTSIERTCLEQCVRHAPISVDALTEVVSPVLALRAYGLRSDGLRTEDGKRIGRQVIDRLAALSLIEIDSARTLTLHEYAQGFYKAQGLLETPRPTSPAAEAPPLAADRHNKHPEAVDEAVRVLSGEKASIGRLQELAESLKRIGYFDYARKILAHARNGLDPQGPASLRLRLGQQHALCTYKDTELPGKMRFQQALHILGEVDDPDRSQTQETLGLAGAIFKQQWSFDGQLEHLHRSLAYYRKGYELGVERDRGYTAINAAFALELLGSQEQQRGSASPRLVEARKIREDVAARLPRMLLAPGGNDLENDWWFDVTIAEAYFGLQQYSDARYWLREARALPVEEWQLETTARQLASIAVLQHEGHRLDVDSEASRTLRVFLGDDTALRSISVGKVGLALSGGGFRAALFHIGVLAKLAELDALRYVEVLSCVSGGSIIGAHYYLELREVLESTPDAEITRQTYIDLVARIERDFLAGVRQNIRMRMAAHPWHTLRAAFQPGFSLTERLGELFERCIFSKAGTADGNRRFWISDLIVQPKDTAPGFLPKTGNWRRAAKVPILVLNSTTLNTGHVWQFTASSMGEPPYAVMTEIDSNDLLRRFYYWQAPGAYKRVRLGRAVAASACVPMLFDPLEFPNLYPDRTIKLVDGGVHDNQGTAALLEQDCAVLLVSDASGQTDSENSPSTGLLGTAGRMNNLLMARVREAEYGDLDARRRSKLLRGLMYLHLKRDLDTELVAWNGCDEPAEESDQAARSRSQPRTTYGIFKEMQASLAALRTDLDAFNDQEAYALMLSGYRMANNAYEGDLPTLPPSSGTPAPWQFLGIQAAAERSRGKEREYDQLLRTVRIGRYLFGKTWRFPVIADTAKIAGVTALLALSFLSVRLSAARAPVPTTILVRSLIGILVVLALAIGWRVAFGKQIRQFLTGILLALASPLIWLHLWLVTPVYLRLGAVDRSSAPSWANLALRWFVAVAAIIAVVGTAYVLVGLG